MRVEPFNDTGGDGLLERPDEMQELRIEFLRAPLRHAGTGLPAIFQPPSGYAADADETRQARPEDKVCAWQA